MMRRVDQSIMSRAPVAVSAMTKIVPTSYRPHFTRKFVVVPFENGLLIDGARGLQILQGKAMGVLLPDLIEVMDGSRTTEEIQAAFVTIPPEDIQAAISTLSECGLIEDGGCETPPAGWNAETFSYLQRYVGALSDCPNAQEAYAEFRNRETLVVASSEARLQADLLTSVLRKTGVKSVIRVSRTEFPWDVPTPESKPSELTSLIVSVATGPLEDEWHLKLDDWCYEQRRPWLRVMLDESDRGFEVGPYFYSGGGPCFRCSFPQLRPLPPLHSYRVSAPIALHLQIGMVATEIVYLSIRIISPSKVGEVRRYNGDLQLVGSSRCVFIPGCARCRPTPRAPQRHSEAKIDTAIVFEDYIGRRSRDDPISSNKNVVVGVGARNHVPGRRMSNCPAVNLSRELPHLNSPVLDIDIKPANGPTPIGTLTLDNVGPLLLMTAGVRRYGMRRVKRWAATGGNLGSVELFLIANRVEGLKPGTYFYEAADHTLSLVERHRERMPLNDFVRRVQANGSGDMPAALVIFTGAFHRLREKYGAFGYRLTHLDAGVGISQMRLLASALKIPCHPMRRWPDDLIEDFLSLESLDEIPTGILTLCASSEQALSVATRPGAPASNRNLDQFIGLSAEEITRMVYKDGHMNESDLALGMAGCLVAGVIPGAARRSLGMDGYTNASLLAFAAGHGSLHPRRLLSKQIVPATTARLIKEDA